MLRRTCHGTTTHVPFRDCRLGNWLTPEQGRRLLTQRTPTTPRELRDHAMLLGCGLRRGELLALRVGWIQQREEHWGIADLVGKGGHVRTVPMPAWVKDAIDAWTAVASITEGTVFRAISKGGPRLAKRDDSESSVGRRAECGRRRR